jgi:RNA polymerase sigma-70 factor (ECF subfamily)
MVTDLRPDVPLAAPAVDAESLARAYDDHAASMFRVLRRLGVPEASSEDAVQDVFLTAWRKRLEFEGRSTQRTWLYGIALRIARDYRHQRDRRAREVDDAELTHRGPDPEAQTAQAHALRQLDAWLERMSDPLREVFVLMEVEQLRAKEVADLLQIPMNTVYSRLRLAREHLASSIESAGLSEGGKP